MAVKCNSTINLQKKKLLPFLLDSYMGSFDGIAMSRWLNSIIYKLKTIPTTTMIYYTILVGYLCHLDIGKKEKKVLMAQILDLDRKLIPAVAFPLLLHTYISLFGTALSRLEKSLQKESRRGRREANCSV